MLTGDGDGASLRNISANRASKTLAPQAASSQSLVFVVMNGIPILDIAEYSIRASFLQGCSVAKQ